MTVKWKASTLLLLAQVLFVIFFGVFVEYGEEVGPLPINVTKDYVSANKRSELEEFYPMYQDVHVMMLVGFGFLMTFLRRHGFGSVGFTFLILCYVIEWSLLVNGWFEMITSGASKIIISIKSLLHADFAAATVLISFCAILGVASPAQLIIMATLELFFYNISIFVGVHILGALDVGGSIFVHVFGAYFGLVVARVLYKESQTTSNKEESNYKSDLFAMIGTTFLWVFWPSFNACTASGNERHRAVINTVISLSSCTVVTFALSSLVGKKKKLNMVHIQNVTLAGGVAIGASADLIVHPFGALLIGSFTALVTLFSFQFLQPFLLRTIKLHDTCGVHNLHGLPGALGAVASAIAIGVANKETYKESYDVFFGSPRSLYRISILPAGAQIAALLVSVTIAILSGAMTGFLMKIPIWDNLTSDEFYEDNTIWQINDDENEIPKKDVHQLQKRNNEPYECAA